MRRLAALLLIAASSLPAQTVSSIPSWTLSPRPTLDIGDEATTQTQFNGVTGIVRLARGEIAVANGMSQELRVFSPAGAYLRTLAKAGSGIGELRSLYRIWGAGDTVFAAESFSEESSVHVFTSTAFITKHRVGSSNAGGVRPLDRFADGRYAVTAAARGRRQMESGKLFSDSALLGVLSLNVAAAPTWVGKLVSDMVTMSTGGGRRRVVMAAVPYGRSTAYAVSGDRLWVGNSETGVVEQFNSLGRKIGGFNAPIAQRPLDPTALDRKRVTGVGDAMNWYGAGPVVGLIDIPLPRHAPRFSRFLAGVDGEMWVELYAENENGPKAFLILDRAGTAIGRVALPPRVAPFAIESDAILGTRVDDDGLERVVQYSFRRR